MRMACKGCAHLGKTFHLNHVHTMQPIEKYPPKSVHDMRGFVHDMQGFVHDMQGLCNPLKASCMSTGMACTPFERLPNHVHDRQGPVHPDQKTVCVSIHAQVQAHRAHDQA